MVRKIKTSTVTSKAEPITLEVESRYFSEEEIQAIKDSSLGFPLMFCEQGLNDKVICIFEVASIGGMAENNGNPKMITIIKKEKGQKNLYLDFQLTKTRIKED